MNKYTFSKFFTLMALLLLITVPSISLCEETNVVSQAAVSNNDANIRIENYEKRLEKFDSDLSDIKIDMGNSRLAAFNTTMSGIQSLLGIFGVLASIITLLFVVFGFLGYQNIKEIKDYNEKLYKETESRIDELKKTSMIEIAQEVFNSSFKDKEAELHDLKAELLKPRGESKSDHTRDASANAFEIGGNNGK